MTPLRVVLTRTVVIGSLLVSALFLNGLACQSPDTFLRKDDAGQPGIGGHGVGGFSGLGGATGVGGRFGTGGATGLGGATGADGGTGVGGRTGADAGVGGTTGTGGASDGGTDAPGVGGRTGTGGATGDGGPGTGPCAGLCAPSTRIFDFVVSPGMDFHSNNIGDIGLGEGCYETTSATVQGVVCSNFMSRTLSVNGVLAPTCVFPSPPPPRINGGYCFQISPGSPTFAALAVY